MEAGRISYGRIATLGVLGFLALASYGFARPAVESMFLGTYGSRHLPIVWIAVGVAVVMVVTVYNHFAARLHPAKLFAASAMTSALVLLALIGLRFAGMGYADFLLYVWKDVYIVVLVEIFWTYANLVVPVKTARWLYGGFLLCGTLGSVAAELSVGKVAKAYGTLSSLYVVLALLGTLAFVCTVARRYLPVTDGPAPTQQKPGLLQSFAVLKRSRYVVLLLTLVATVQVAITLVDYHFNHEVLAAFPDEALRTEMVGKVYAAIDASAFVLQLLCGVVLRYVGVPMTLLLLPAILGGVVVIGMLSPRFLTVALSKVVSKAFDYSLFRAAKEILYIPLSNEEKTRGKALVDIFGYRVAKASASLLLLTVVASDGQSLGWAIVMCTLLWFVVTRFVTKSFKNSTVDTDNATR